MNSYQELLREQYIQKRKKNPQFSLRAFAKQLGLTPGGMSRLMNGKMELSVNRAMEISEKLGLTEEETDTFINLVQLSKAKTNSSKEQILKKIEKLQGVPIHDLSVDHFKLISEWYPMAILRITAEPKMSRTISGIAKALGITNAEVSQTVERLKRLELIEEDEKGNFTRATDHVQINFKKDHEAARAYYGALTKLMLNNIETENRNTRSIGSEVLVFDKTQIEHVRKITDEYLNQLIALSKKSQKKEQLYQAISSVFEIKGKTKE